MARKKSDPNPTDESELMEQTEENAVPDVTSEITMDEAVQEQTASANENDSLGQVDAVPKEAASTDAVPTDEGEYGDLLQELGESGTHPVDAPEALQPEQTDTGYSADDLLLLSEDEKAQPLPELPIQTEANTTLRSPAYMARRERILTIDAKDEVQTEEEREATIWHEVQNAYRTRRILTGTLDGIEHTESGLTIAVVNYKGFRVAIPIKQMMLQVGRMPTGEEYIDLMEQLSRVLNARLGSEIDFIVKGIENKSRSIVASRKDAMLKKRQTFYMDTDELGEPMIYEGRVVQARVVAVAEKIIRVEVFGVECSIRAQGLSWEWIGNARDHFFVGDRILVRILKVERPDVENITISADVRSVSSTNNIDNLQKIIPQSRYAGRVTEVRNGVVYIRLNNGVNAIAHSCYDRRTPGKKDDISFHVTRIDEEMGVAVGIITRIIKQNL